MRILGIESSSLVASVAIVEDGVTMGEYTVNFKKTHSQTLLPMIDELVKMLGISLDRASDRLGDGQGAWVCAEKAAHPCSDVRGHGLQPVRCAGAYLPDHGCEAEPGLHRALSV